MKKITTEQYMTAKKIAFSMKSGEQIFMQDVDVICMNYGGRYMVCVTYPISKPDITTTVMGVKYYGREVSPAGTMVG